MKFIGHKGYVYYLMVFTIVTADVPCGICNNDGDFSEYTRNQLDKNKLDIQEQYFSSGTYVYLGD